MTQTTLSKHAGCCIITIYPSLLYPVLHINLQNVDLSFNGFVFCKCLFHTVFCVQLRIFPLVNVPVNDQHMTNAPGRTHTIAFTTFLQLFSEFFSNKKEIYDFLTSGGYQNAPWHRWIVKIHNSTNHLYLFLIQCCILTQIRKLELELITDKTESASSTKTQPKVKTWHEMKTKLKQ